MIVDPGSGEALSLASMALQEVSRNASTAEKESLTGELTREQIETTTRPCPSLDALGAELRRWRRAADTAAGAAGARVAALATPPLPVRPSITPSPRYQEMIEQFGPTAQQQLTCGCHVHVEVDSDEEGVAVLDRVRGWLPALLAISANSPFWQGEDTGYASFRSQVWNRWPSAGPTELFGSAETYHATVRAMLKSGTLLDEGMVYFDARLSPHHPTVEVRVADVCLCSDDAVLLAALTRALVQTAVDAWRADLPPIPLRSELLRLTSWRAGRSGLDDTLVGPTGRPAPAHQVIRQLIEHVRPALQESGDLDTVEDLVTALLRRGNGAHAQRAVFHSSNRLADVVRHAVRHTVAT